MHPHGHGADVVRDSRHFRRFPGIVQAQFRRGNDDIGIDIPLKQLSVLHDHTDMLPQRFEICLCEILSIIIDRSLLRLFKAQHQPHQGGFSAAGFPDNGHILTGTDF